MAYKSLSKEHQARIDPMITGFNFAVMYPADHSRRVLTLFPGAFSGIGESCVHKEFVSPKIAAALEDGKTQRESSAGGADNGTRVGRGTMRCKRGGAFLMAAVPDDVILRRIDCGRWPMLTNNLRMRI
jgi:hypothetical protein